jgi:hypothetical protein
VWFLKKCSVLLILMVKLISFTKALLVSGVIKWCEIQ